MRSRTSNAPRSGRHRRSESPGVLIVEILRIRRFKYSRRTQESNSAKGLNVKHVVYAVIAHDERNEVRDVQDWAEVQRKVGVESGAKFWRLWGKGLELK